MNRESLYTEVIITLRVKLLWLGWSCLMPLGFCRIHL